MSLLFKLNLDAQSSLYCSPGHSYKSRFKKIYSFLMYILLYCIRRNLKHCNKKFKETAYISLLRSVMDYSATVWDPYLQKDIDRIEGVQRRAARLIFNDCMRSSSVMTAMMESLKWTPLAERRREQRLILLFKIVNDLVVIPTDDITFNSRPSRNSNNRQIKVLSTNTDTGYI